MFRVAICLNFTGTIAGTGFAAAGLWVAFAASPQAARRDVPGKPDTFLGVRLRRI